MDALKKQDRQEALIDVIFDGRNKSFGAYQLRKMYNERLFLAFLISTSLFILGVMTPTIKGLLFPAKIDPVIDLPKPTTSTLVNIIDIPAPKPQGGGGKKAIIPASTENNDPQKPIVEPIVTDEEAENIVMDENADPNATETDQSGSLDGGDGEGGDGPGTGGDGPGFGGDGTGEADDDFIYDFLESNPEFPGGDDGLRKYLNNTIKYPKLARDYNVTGRVIVEFIIEKDGSVSSVKVLDPKGYGLDEESIRVVKNMPKWKPGIYNKEAVRFVYRLPIVYTLR